MELHASTHTPVSVSIPCRAGVPSSWHRSALWKGTSTSRKERDSSLERSRSFTNWLAETGKNIGFYNCFFLNYTLIFVSDKMAQIAMLKIIEDILRHSKQTKARFWVHWHFNSGWVWDIAMATVCGNDGWLDETRLVSGSTFTPSSSSPSSSC